MDNVDAAISKIKQISDDMCIPEWMPANPCQPDCKTRDSYCPPDNRFACKEKQIYDAQVEAIAARDKWWVAKLNEELTLIRLTAGQDDFAPGYYVAMPEVRWDELKKSILGNER